MRLYVAFCFVMPAPGWATLAVTVTVLVTAVFGVPPICPVAGLIESPAGSPVADQVMVTLPVAATVAE